ncbi:MAG: hypothetical protein QW769_05545 [Nitrososphaerales archaeon]
MGTVFIDSFSPKSMHLDGQFVAGIAMIVFGALLITMGTMLTDFMPVLLPVALVFIFAGIALKVISVKNLG